MQRNLENMLSAHVRSRQSGIPYASTQIKRVAQAYVQWRQAALANRSTAAFLG